MKHKFLSSLMAVICLVLIFAACSKQSDPSLTATTDAEVAAHSDDENRVSTEMDGVSTDINVALESDNSFSGNAATVTELVCDAAVTVNKTSDPMTITIDYNGANCGGLRKRTGKVVVSMAKETKWKNQGASIVVNFQDLKITRTKDNKSITINGSDTVTNESGGLLVNLASSGPIVHAIRSNEMSITFDNGAKRTWHVARRHTFTFDGGAILTVTGFHAIGGSSNIVEWGENRFGKEFTTAITGDLIIKQSCDFRLTSGEITHVSDDFTAVVSFGLDIAGLATGCPGTGNYYYKVGATRKNGNHFEIILPY
ncbi:MAG: hypothetical protein ABI415_02600 [Flavitalea sp.]